MFRRVRVFFGKGTPPRYRASFPSPTYPWTGHGVELRALPRCQVVKCPNKGSAGGIGASLTHPLGVNLPAACTR